MYTTRNSNPGISFANSCILSLSRSRPVMMSFLPMAWNRRARASLMLRVAPRMRIVEIRADILVEDGA